MSSPSRAEVFRYGNLSASVFDPMCFVTTGPDCVVPSKCPNVTTSRTADRFQASDLMLLQNQLNEELISQ